MKILFAVRSLNIGVTERQIISMSNMLINYGHEVDIARIYPNGDLEKYTKAYLHTLSKNIFFRAIDFHRLYRHKNYDVAYSFLPNMNIFSLLISSFGFALISASLIAYSLSKLENFYKNISFGFSIIFMILGILGIAIVSVAFDVNNSENNFPVLIPVFLGILLIQIFSIVVGLKIRNINE